MEAKSVVAGIVSAAFLGACVWGTSALVAAGVDPVRPQTPAPASYSLVAIDSTR